MRLSLNQDTLTTVLMRDLRMSNLIHLTESEINLIILGIHAAIVRTDKELLKTSNKDLKRIRNQRIAELLTLEQKLTKTLNHSAQKAD